MDAGEYNQLVEYRGKKGNASEVVSNFEGKLASDGVSCKFFNTEPVISFASERRRVEYGKDGTVSALEHEYKTVTCCCSIL